MAKLYNLARVASATAGTGTITLGAAVSGYLTFALAGVADGETVAYGIKDGANSEVGTGVYTSAGTTLTRSVTKSTNSDAAISLSGSAEVYITARKEDFLNAADPLTSPQVAAQSDMEAANSTTLAVPPGRQHNHPSHPKAVYSATITPTAISGAATSWDTGTDLCLWNTTHGLSSGDVIYIASLPPTGATASTCYFAGVTDTTHFSLHLTQADALAGTNKVNITASALTTLRKWVATNVVSYGMASTGAVGPAPAANANIGLAFTLSPVFSAAAVSCRISHSGLVASSSNPAAGISFVCPPTTIAAGVISYANSTILLGGSGGSAGLGFLPSNWSGQGTTAFTIMFEASGDL